MIWNRLFLVLGAAWLLQAFMTWRQVQNFQNTVREMARRPDGFLGVGTYRKWLRRGAVVILVADSTGRIADGKALTGVTVFAKPKPYTQWVGKELGEAMEAAGAARPRTGLLEATVSALNQIQVQQERAQAKEHEVSSEQLA